MMHKAWKRIEEVPYCFSRSYRPAYPHDFGVQYTGFRLILRPSPLVSLLYDICKILTIMYDIVFVWQYLIIVHQNIRLVGAQWKGNSEMEPVLNTLGCTRFGQSMYSISWWFPFEHRKGVRKLNTCTAVGLCRGLELFISNLLPGTVMGI